MLVINYIFIIWHMVIIDVGGGSGGDGWVVDCNGEICDQCAGKVSCPE